MPQSERYPTLGADLLEDVTATLRGLHWDLCERCAKLKAEGKSGDYAKMKADNVLAAIAQIEQADALKKALKDFSK
jgi:hypothetical protein